MLAHEKLLEKQYCESYTRQDSLTSMKKLYCVMQKCCRETCCRMGSSLVAFVKVNARISRKKQFLKLEGHKW